MTFQQSLFWMTFGPRFVPSITVLTLQYSSCWLCFSEIKNKSTANVSIFSSHKFFCGTKEKMCSKNMHVLCHLVSRRSDRRNINPLKFPPRNIYPLNLSNLCSHEPLAILSWLLLAPSMPASHTQQTQFGAFNNWRVRGKKIHNLPPFHADTLW